MPEQELDRVDTPALIVDLDVVEANVKREQNRADERGVQLWPHTKTHKSAWLAQRQMALGAAGLTVAKLGEAEVMRAAGLTTLLIAYPLIGPTKAERLARLLEMGTDIRVAIDSREAADTIARAAQRAGTATVGILIEIDTGFHRVGLPPGEAAIPLARYVAASPGLRLLGLCSFAGHISGADTEEQRHGILRQEALGLGQTRDAFLRASLPVDVISVGGTHHGARMNALEIATDLRPGTYIYNDRNTLVAGSCGEEDCAARVLVTVVSAHESWAVIDGGSKTFSSDTHLHGGFGLVCGRPDLAFERMSEEHGILTWPRDGQRLFVGERLEIIPNHICPVVNLCDVAIGTRAGRFERLIGIDGRGKSQ